MDSLKESFEDVDWAGLAGKVAAAIVILVVTWLIAKLVQAAFVKATQKVTVLQKAGSDGESIGASLGTIGSLLVWMFGLMALLQLFGLTQTLAPIQNLLNGVTGFIPNLIGAALIFVVGSLLAKVVRQLVETALGALPFDKWLNRAGADEVTGNTSISKTLALVLYALIMIVVAIAALQVLGISSISEPAEQMLNTIFTAIPNIIAAALLLGIGVVIARFAGDLLEELLNGFGVDRSLHAMEVLPADKSATPAIAKIAQVGIVLFFAVMAAQLLEFPQVTEFLSAILELGGRVIFGAAVIAVGVLIANQLARLATGSGGTIIKGATIVLFAAMGLKFMGIADSIIELGFGAVVIGGALAAALAFGLGGREAAAQQLARLQQSAANSSTGGPAGGPAGGSTGGTHSGDPLGGPTV
ncbi:mechanosensitive ion channel [Nocardioides sp. Soil796]|uniref:mechanosensitive ion channel n=1 Tax=Nocardioides sp. Soil796 TaxID=1736412 RepID=UPI0009EB4B0B|nr:mechanosensitive ion channel [Nocardioides sp. Soil796]